LWDFRKTISDLIADEHMVSWKRRCTNGTWPLRESHESGRALVADGMEMKKFNEVPMSAMWTSCLE